MENGSRRLIADIEITTRNELAMVKNRDTFGVVDISLDTLFSKKTFFNIQGAIKINGGTVALVKCCVVSPNGGEIFNGELNTGIAFADLAV